MTNKTKVIDGRVTFRGETPDTSDLVLCDYCGGSLHDPEHNLFWEQTKDHYCEPAKDARIAELEAQNRELALQIISSDGQAMDAYDAQMKAEQRAEAAEAKAQNSLPKQ